MTEPETPGPVEAGSWPTKLPAHVMTATGPRRAHGFAVVGDLAKHYDFAEVAFTVLAGAPPDRAWGRALNLALVALSGTSVAEAPVHAATLSRRATAPPRTALAIGVLGLVEQADHALDQAAASGPPDADARQLWDLLPQPVRDSMDPPTSTAEALAIEILRAAGLTSRTQLIAALTLARLPALAAEVDAVAPGDVRGYPMRLPDFHYLDGDDG